MGWSCMFSLNAFPCFFFQHSEKVIFYGYNVIRGLKSCTFLSVETIL